MLCLRLLTQSVINVSIRTPHLLEKLDKSAYVHEDLGNAAEAESEEDKGDFTPIEGDYGDFVEWRGVSLTHGNKINQTNASRVSVDFRIIPLSQWKPAEGSAINTGVKFDIGGYYEIMK